MYLSASFRYENPHLLCTLATAEVGSVNTFVSHPPVLTNVQPNPLRSTFHLLANPFFVGLHEPSHQPHNVLRAHHCHPVPCRFRGRPCTLQTHRVRYSIGPLDLKIAVDLFAIFPTALTWFPARLLACRPRTTQLRTRTAKLSMETQNATLCQTLFNLSRRHWVLPCLDPAFVHLTTPANNA